MKRKIEFAWVGERQAFTRSAISTAECLKIKDKREKLTMFQIHVRTKCHFWPVMGTCQQGFVWILQGANCLL
jgi:hypothetical protein